MTDHPSLATALAAFQRELPAVSKTAVGQVPGKRAYKYADLADLSAVVLPLLGKHGLSFTAMPTLDDASRFGLRYELLHTSGESRSGFYPLPTGTAWEVGSALTYGRRYCLAAVTGVAADEDDDGAASLQARHAEPVALKPSAAQARGTLGADAKANGWSLDIIARLYRDEHGEDLAKATDPARIEAFRKGLYARSDSELKAAAS